MLGDAAEEDLRLAQGAYDAAQADVASDLVEAHRFYVGEADNDDETLIAAFARAWEALIDVSPQAREAAAEFENIDLAPEQVEAHLQHIEEVSQRLGNWRSIYRWYGEVAGLSNSYDYAQGAITKAERVGVNAADLTALSDAIDNTRTESFARDDTRQLAVIEAEDARQAGAIRSVAAAAAAVDEAEHAAARALKTLEHNVRESAAAYFDVGGRSGCRKRRSCAGFCHDSH